MTYKAQDDERIWSGFASNPWHPPSSLPLKKYISGKTLLITGAGGSIGSALVRFATTSEAKSLILLDSNEHTLHALEESFNVPSKVTHVPILGSICDSILLAEVFGRYRPEIVLHAAACKHVPLMELNPIAAANTNVVGTYALLHAASTYGAAHFIMVSTDKAVLPISIMGATKRLAELLLLAHPKQTLQRKAVRLGNVLGSSGSVGPLFLKQIKEGGPVTITHREARRFFLTLNHAVTLLVAALSPEYETGILIPDLGPARTIGELADYLIATTAREQQKIEVMLTGLRPGDKIEELLLSSVERDQVQESDYFSVLCPNELDTEMLYAVLEQITIGVSQRDLRLVLESVCQAVPEYRPSCALKQVITNELYTQLRK